MRQKPPQQGEASSAEGWKAGRQELPDAADRRKRKSKPLGGGAGCRVRNSRERGRPDSEERRGPAEVRGSWKAS